MSNRLDQEREDRLKPQRTISKLDKIYKNTFYNNVPKGMAYNINLANDVVYQALRDQIKELMLDLVHTSKSKKDLIKKITEL